MRTFVLMIVCGCWRGGETSTTPPNEEPTVRASRPQGAPCEEVADHVREVLGASEDEPLRLRADQLRGVIVRRCAADNWSMELRRCLAGAANIDDTDGCEKLATQEQQDALEHDVELTENAD